MDTTPSIHHALSTLAAEKGVRILYACESGSRAWGFESADSDFDVRFIYCHPTDWYLCVDMDRKPTVIDVPIDSELDLSGWDLAKTLRLYHKTNPPLFEWLGSPIAYADRFGLAENLRKVGPDFYCPRAAAWHYLRMAQNNWRGHLRRPVVRTKKYLYALRPLLAVLWIERGLGVVPTPFGRLVDTMVEAPTLKAAIDELLARKRAGPELGEGPPIDPIHQFIKQHIERLEATINELPAPRGRMETLNELFRDTLRTAWE